MKCVIIWNLIYKNGFKWNELIQVYISFFKKNKLKKTIIKKEWVFEWSNFVLGKWITRLTY